MPKHLIARGNCLSRINAPQVIPAEAGIQTFQCVTSALDTGFHRCDEFCNWLRIMAVAMFWLGLLAVNLADTPAWGTDKSAAQATITLDVKNEPLQSVLGKITRKTGWKIKVPDKWLDMPVTQTLNKATLEDGLKSVLNNAGVVNLLITYDEYFKVVTVFDTESSSTSAAATSPAQTRAQPSVVTAPPEPDPRLQSAAIDTGSRPAPRSRRARRQSSEDD
jgi:hypothetical protein